MAFVWIESTVEIHDWSSSFLTKLISYFYYMTKSFPLINLYQFKFSSNQQVHHNRYMNFRTKLQTNIIGIENKPYPSKFIKKIGFYELGRV